MTTTAVPIYQAALDRGLSIHPLHPRSKEPALKEWQLKARCSAETMAAYPGHNYGVAANDEFLILESDDLREFARRLGAPLPVTYTVQARENRPHYYFRQTDASRRLGNRVLPGIFEFNQSNAYVVGEGSTHPSGATYQCVCSAPIIPIPSGLVERLAAMQGELGNGMSVPLPKFGEIVGEGSRHYMLRSHAGRIWDGEKSEEEMFAELDAINQEHCDPPKPAHKLVGIIDWVMNKKPNVAGPKIVIGATKVIFDGDPDDYRSLFHSYDDIANAPPLTFAINGWLQADGITMYGGLPGHGKTLLGLSTARALLTGEPLFGHPHFSVTRAQRVLYLCPEVGRGPLAHRIKLFGLLPFVKSGELLVRTLASPDVPLMDPRILRAAEGADVFLDTAVRFMEGEENSSSEQRTFAKNLFTLLSAGARTAVGLHHSPKYAKDSGEMTLENALRGTNELGAMLSTAWGTKLVDKASTRLYIQNLKPRDFDPVGAFTLEGRPYIDQTGDLKVVEQPGEAHLRNHQNKGGRPSNIEGGEGEIRRLKAKGLSNVEIARCMDVSIDSIKYFFKKERQAAADAKGKTQ